MQDYGKLLPFDNNRRIALMAARPKRRVPLRILLSIPLLAAAIAHGQTPPDAGTLLREQPKPPAVPQPPLKPPVVERPAAAPDESGPRVRVTAIRIRGNTRIPEAELVAQLRELVGQERSFGQLQNAALVLIGYYAQKGYLARVFLPPQDIKDGIVEYQVIEGIRGSLKIDKKGERIDVSRVQRFIDEWLAAGSAMDLAGLSEALTVLNEQPGVQVFSTLAPGKGDREIDVTVTAADKPLLSYNAGLNNQGSRGTGVWQATGGATLANPSGRFDALSVLANASQGSTYGRADYSLAIGDRGLRMGVNASALQYKLVQASFAALQANGTAETVGLTASYPLARRTAFNLSLNGGFDYKRLVDHTVAGETGNRTVNVANLGIGGYSIATEGVLQGVQSFGASLVAGNADQRNAAALAADRAGRNTQGSYAKVAWNLGLLRGLDENWTFNASARGQFAGKNLDSSERFSLGGPFGIRAYPVAEGVGDDGWLAGFNLSRRFGDQLSLGGFVDVGGITVNHSVPAAGITTPNRYTLAGAGLNLAWQLAPQMSFNVSVAAPIGNNPAKDANGRNNDGSAANAGRAWLTLVAQF